MILLIHSAATLFMTGLIWFVQVVHYPLMARVGRSGFAEYEQAHSASTTLVVAAPMLIELGTAIWLVAFPPARNLSGAAWLGLILVVLIWASTWLLQVPQHEILAHGFESQAHQRLVATNWIRTWLWSLRAILVLWMLRTTS
ncbi:MAG: hypothetical protein NZV14_14135 [Bryobacteraceae bacterium]|nr:hypothetical protein [Bryobacteraceae bacterium]MDW8379300.1 hypothetical protein [Bryobacterales bacterium]